MFQQPRKLKIETDIEEYSQIIVKSIVDCTRELSRKQREMVVEDPKFKEESDKKGWSQFLQSACLEEKELDGRFVLVSTRHDPEFVVGQSALIKTMILTFRNCQDKIARIAFENIVYDALVNKEQIDINRMLCAIDEFKKDRNVNFENMFLNFGLSRHIDLHIHTKYSDGTNTSKEIIDLVDSKGISIFSVTDHDSVDFYFDVARDVAINQEYEKKYIKMIPGVEITCRYNKTIRDVLGYGVNVNVIKYWLENRYSLENRINKQKQIVQHLKQVFTKKGIKFDESIDAHEGKKSEGLIAMINSASKYPENFDICPDLINASAFYNNQYSIPTSEFYFDEACDALTIQEAIKIIHKAGGLAFLAHPYKYRMSDKDTEDFILNAFRCEVDGIEVLHSSNKDDDVVKLRKIAKKYHLFICGGSDYHGTIKPDTKLVTGIDNNMRVDYCDIAPWIDKLSNYIII